MKAAELEALEIQRPTIELVVRETGWDYWGPLFKRWHYLPLDPMPFSTAYVGFVDDEPTCHIGVAGMVIGKGRRVARACRMVVLPDWMGAGVGTTLLDWIAERERRGEGFIGRPVPTIFHTSHPGLIFVLNRNPKWRRVSKHLHGSPHNKQDKYHDLMKGWGRHAHATSGFRYYGEAGVRALAKEAQK